MKRTSLNDIAQHLVVSIIFVFPVLSGKGKEHCISDEVCKNVIKEAKELNYLPCQITKRLRSGKANITVLLVVDIANLVFAVSAVFLTWLVVHKFQDK